MKGTILSDKFVYDNLLPSFSLASGNYIKYDLLNVTLK